MKVSVVIPVFNEEGTIRQIIKEVQDIDIDKEIIVINDGSTDKTRDILQNLKEDNVKILFHDKNLGKHFMWIGEPVLPSKDGAIK